MSTPVYRIEIAESGDPEYLADVLDRVADLLREGFTSGYDPDWDTLVVFQRDVEQDGTGRR